MEEILYKRTSKMKGKEMERNLRKWQEMIWCRDKISVKGDMMRESNTVRAQSY